MVFQWKKNFIWIFPWKFLIKKFRSLNGFHLVFPWKYFIQWRFHRKFYFNSCSLLLFFMISEEKIMKKSEFDEWIQTFFSHSLHRIFLIQSLHSIKEKLRLKMIIFIRSTNFFSFFAFLPFPIFSISTQISSIFSQCLLTLEIQFHLEIQLVQGFIQNSLFKKTNRRKWKINKIIDVEWNRFKKEKKNKTCKQNNENRSTTNIFSSSLNVNCCLYLNVVKQCVYFMPCALRWSFKNHSKWNLDFCLA